MQICEDEGRVVEDEATMAEATDYFTGKKIRHFPVVYTTADHEAMSGGETLQAGVYFLERDLFRFTNRFGILRIHRMKLGKVLQKKYPFLS